MGYTVWCGEKELSSLSARTGPLFLLQVRTLEETIGATSGIEMQLADTIEIDAPKLEEFIPLSLVRLAESNNAALFSLLSGSIVIALSFVAEATGRWPTVPDRFRGLLSHAQHVFRPLDEYLEGLAGDGYGQTEK